MTFYAGSGRTAAGLRGESRVSLKDSDPREFDRRMASLDGVVDADQLKEKLWSRDRDLARNAESELTAIYLLRTWNPRAAVEYEPRIRVGARNRQPDFRTRSHTDDWTYVEVTQLGESIHSARHQSLISRISGRLRALESTFVAEVLLWREPVSHEEEAELVRQASEFCSSAKPGSQDELWDLATLTMKSGDPSTVIVSDSPDDRRPRMAVAGAVLGPNAPNRQVVVRIPSADERAAQVLKAEAKQLPEDGSGLVVVNTNRQPSAFTSWPDLLRDRFASKQHTRVGGLLMFMSFLGNATEGWLHSVKLVLNPHARPLPDWIPQAVENSRAENQRRTGRAD